MKQTLPTLVALSLAFLSSSASAELAAGKLAPDFTTQGALAGKPFALKLSNALKKGAVVLYFYPKAFTQGCTLEAHAFAEATDDFAKLGATVIGMSNDDLPTLQRFSTAECRDKFAVAAATPDIIKAYDVAFKVPPEMAARMKSAPAGLTSRTSFVIAKNGTITMAYSNLDYKDHVTKALEAVKALKVRVRTQ